MESVNGLMAALERRRSELGLSQVDMAARIGLQRLQYHRLLHGYPPGKKALGGVLVAFPDLWPEVAEELRAAARGEG